MSAATTDVWMARVHRWVAGGALSWVAGLMAAVPALVGSWFALTSPPELGLPQVDSPVLSLGWGLGVAAVIVWLCLLRQRWACRVTLAVGGALALAGVWAVAVPLGTDQPSMAFYIGLILVLTGVWGVLMGLRRARWRAQWLVVSVLGLAWLYAYLGVMGSSQGTVFMLDLLESVSLWWHVATLALGFAMAALMAERAGLWGLYAQRPDLRLVGFISIMLVAAVVTCISLSLLVAGHWSSWHLTRQAVDVVRSPEHRLHDIASQREWVLLMVAGTGALVWLVTQALALFLQPLMTRLREYRQIFDGMPLPMLALDGGGRVSALNTEAEQLWQVRSTEVAGTLVWDLFQDKGFAVHMTDPHMQPGVVELGLNRLQRGDGSTQSVVLTLIPVQRDNGVVRWMLLANDDLRDSQDRQRLRAFEEVFEQAVQGIAIGQADGRKLARVNPSFAAMHGGTVADYQNHPLVEVFAPRERARVAAYASEAHQRGYFEFDSWHIRQDGREFPVRVKVRVVNDPETNNPYRIAFVDDLTEQHHLRDRLTEAEHTARLVLDAQPDCIVRWEPNGRIQFANSRMARLLGTTDVALVGQDLVALMTPLQLPEIGAGDMATHAASLQLSPRLQSLEHRLQTPLGGRWMAWSTVPVFDAQGEVRVYQSIGQDVTARKTAEKTLAMRETWFRSVLDSRRNFTVVLDERGAIQAIGRNAAALFQRAQSDLLGLVYAELELFEMQRAVQAQVRDGIAAAMGGRSTEAAVSLTDAQGKARQFEVVFRRMSEGATGHDRFVLVESHDVTALNAQQRALQDRDARFQAFTDTVPGAVFEFYREGDAARLTYANQACCQLFAGDCNGDPTGRNLLDALMPEDRVAFLQQMERCEPLLTPLRWEGPVVNGSGQWVSVRAHPQAVDGRVLWSGFAMDVSETRLREQDIERSRSDLRELSVHHENLREDERRRMAREVHDELGQNLTALRMGLSVLATLQAGPDALAGEAERLKALVDQSIKVVRGIATTLRPAAMDLGLGSALAWLASEFETNTDLRCALDFEVGDLMLDEATATALFRITQESLTNVARHAQASQVWIRGRHINRHLVLEIVDDGKGFDAGDQTRLQGFGLRGMKERVLSLDGDLVFNSTPGGGTVVSIHLPIKDSVT